MNAKQKWLVLIYIAADNNLAARAKSTLEELKKIVVPGNVRVTLHVDLPREETIVKRLERGELHFVSRAPNRNAGDPTALKEFVAKQLQTAAADEKLALIVFSHGGGYDLLAPDDTARDFLEGSELRQLIASVERPFEMVGCDACSMSMIELAYQLREAADLFLASPSLVKAGGWPYGSLFERMGRNVGLQQLGEEMQQEFAAHRNGTPGSLTPFLLGELRPLQMAFRNMVDELLRLCAKPGGKIKLRQLRGKMHGLFNANSVDLHAMLAVLQREEMSVALTDALRAVDKALGSATRTISAESAVGIHFPERPMTPSEQTGYEGFDFAKDTGWAKFLAEYHAA